MHTESENPVNMSIHEMFNKTVVKSPQKIMEDKFVSFK